MNHVCLTVKMDRTMYIKTYGVNTNEYIKKALRQKTLVLLIMCIYITISFLRPNIF
jgi:hypothetical protein